MESLQARFGRAAASLGFAILGVLLVRTTVTTFREGDALVALLMLASAAGYLVAAWTLRPDAVQVHTRLLAGGLTLAALGHAARLVTAARDPMFTLGLFQYALLVLTVATAVAAAGAWLGTPGRPAPARVWLIRLGMLASAGAFILYIVANVRLDRQPPLSIVLGEFGFRTLFALLIALGYHETDAPAAALPADDATATA